jgi:hypothetical protein
LENESLSENRIDGEVVGSPSFLDISRPLS